MEEAYRTDHSALLREISGAIEQLYHGRELVVMAQSQMAEAPRSVHAKWQNPRDMKARMERLPDFQEQMRANPEFRRTYQNVCAAMDL